MIRTFETGADSLASHLDDPEPGNTSDPALRLILTETLLDETLEFSAVRHLFHVDKIDHDDPPNPGNDDDIGRAPS